MARDCPLWWISWERNTLLSLPSKLLTFLTVMHLFYGSLVMVDEVECFALTVMSERVVFTKQGPVQGFVGPANTGVYHLPHLSGSNYRQYSQSGRPLVEIFKGIPYASAPTGNLRYESPSPIGIRSRTEVYIANLTKPSCPHKTEDLQNRSGYSDPIKDLRRTLRLNSEDCLYLDIYSPLNTIFNKAQEKNGGSGVAVLVYMNSHADDPDNPFDGSSLAAIGNIIVVNVRYRTGVLGFLRPSFSEDTRSNYGMWDQLAALQWIKENIAEFGGQPDNICLMGYDNDAKVSGLLALSPVSQAMDGLFHRLILINGSPFSPNSINTQPLKTTYQLSRAVQCPLDERAGELVNCLRKIPVPRLITTADKNIGSPLLTNPFAPALDGTLIPREVNVHTHNGPGHSQAIKEMLGKYDILCGLKEGPILPRNGRHLLSNIDMDRFITAAIKLTMRLEPGSEPTTDVKREVLKAINGEYGTAPPMRELISDFLMINPMIDLLNTHSKTGKNTFFYVFKDYDPLKLLKHDEISYIFSSNVYKWKFLGGPSQVQDLHQFHLLIIFLANFVRTGDPNILDPKDRYPSTMKSWPKYRPDSGLYLEIANDVRFPSGYRKGSSIFWGKTFIEIIKSFANHTANDQDFAGFPPYFPRNYNTNHQGSNTYYPEGDSRIIHGYPGHDRNHIQGSNGNGEDSSPIIAGGQSTIVLIGALLLLLNFLCFLGLFYQRERLKKAEIQLRKRYIENQKQLGIADGDLDGSSSFERCAPNHLPHLRAPPHHLTNLPQLPRDAMSETETENGFGPDFLGPNYDPRTKVNRWMQNANRSLLSKGPSFEEYSNPTPTPSGHRLSRVREDENPYEMAANPMPIYHISSSIPRTSRMEETQVPYIPLQPQNLQPQQLPMHIQINSLQRGAQPPKALQEQPVQFLPQLPYQEPYRPSGPLCSEIPYADSRATSPSIISAPAGFCSSRMSPKFGPRSDKMTSQNSQTASTPTPTPSSLVGTIEPPNSSNVTDSPKSTSILVMPSNQAPKRSSTLIVRDLDPPDDDLEQEPRYVPVKTGTLKRSVGVDTDHDGSPTVPGAVSEAKFEGPATKSNTIRVTFKENV